MHRVTPIAANEAEGSIYRENDEVVRLVDRMLSLTRTLDEYRSSTANMIIAVLLEQSL